VRGVIVRRRCCGRFDGRLVEQERLNPDVPFGIEGAKVGAQPRAARLLGDIGDWYRYTVHLAGCPAGQVDIEGCGHLAAAEAPCAGSAGEQYLVDVVVENRAAALVRKRVRLMLNASAGASRIESGWPCRVSCARPARCRANQEKRPLGD
jgi:hypothetical protein